MAEWQAICLDYETNKETWFEFLAWREDKKDEVLFAQDAKTSFFAQYAVIKVRDPKLIMWMSLRWNARSLGDYEEWREKIYKLDKDIYTDKDINWKIND